ncbi:hypothetical protein [Paraburkholderia fungorum]|nr:hypothetical protein [Paraburkholderia fungorum]
MQAILKKTTTRRPISLTILGWFSIISNGGSLAYLMLMLREQTDITSLSLDQPPVWTMVVVPIIATTLCTAAGIAILLGLRWGRVVYVGAEGVGLANMVMSIPMQQIVYLASAPLLLFMLFIYLLYRKPATAYFQRTKTLVDGMQDVV